MKALTILSLLTSTTFVAGCVEATRAQPPGRRRTIGWAITVALVLQACTTLILWKVAQR